MPFGPTYLDHQLHPRCSDPFPAMGPRQDKRAGTRWMVWGSNGLGRNGLGRKWSGADIVPDLARAVRLLRWTAATRKQDSTVQPGRWDSRVLAERGGE